MVRTSEKQQPYLSRCMLYNRDRTEAGAPVRTAERHSERRVTINHKSGEHELRLATKRWSIDPWQNLRKKQL